MFTKETYVSRRNRLKKQVGSGLIVLLGNEQSSMNYKDNWYHFRQDSTFLYFFGIDRAGLVAVLDVEDDTEIIFGDELTPDDIVWMGPQKSIREQASEIGVGVTKPISTLDSYFQDALAKKREIHFLPPYRPENLLKLSSWLQTSPASIKSIVSVPLIKAVVAQRSIKTPEEVVEIEKGINTTGEMLKTAALLARAGMTEAELAGQLQAIAIKDGGDLAFPTILTVNGQILHNHYSSAQLQAGQLVLVDCGAASSMHYSGDMTRTFPVNERFSNQQKEMYEVMMTAYEQAVAMLKPGVRYKDVHLQACASLVDGLKQFGLMKGDTQEAVSQGAHALFFPCGLGHMLGLDTHDMEDLGEEYVGYAEDQQKSNQFGLKSLRLARALEPGFVLTVEPGLYFNPDLIDLWAGEKMHADFINYDKVANYKDFGGIRIEEDFLITPEGSRLLGNPVPRNMEEFRSSAG
ncbi:aminopeptidase P family protein [Rufibacter latericius]|uniref:Xaa-Pro aminopeptidase n=1 Tax=Rufibacter latericius TaxID=2487040 RepID=A0A3M9N1R2_9BACT|nr:aminopeptidase P family protein [Rufibacter latericius]RNI31734.1 aminopeptidase P family protein [Rufibacter latericius]